jgi:hypothetical protein
LERRNIMKSGRSVAPILVLGAVLILITGCTSTKAHPEIVLTFDGKTCHYDGPNVVREGEVTIVFNNKTKYEASMWAARLDEGRTWQEMLDYIGPPGAFVERPSWSDGTIMIAAKVPDDPNATVYTLRKGLYAICCCTCLELYGPRGVWPGAPLEVRAK